MIKLHRYAVTITFSEPTFERHSGVAPRCRPVVIDVMAANRSDAIGLAFARFREEEALSWVGWVREIGAVEVIELNGMEA